MPYFFLFGKSPSPAGKRGRICAISQENEKKGGSAKKKSDKKTKNSFKKRKKFVFFFPDGKILCRFLLNYERFFVGKVEFL